MIGSITSGEISETVFKWIGIGWEKAKKGKMVICFKWPSLAVVGVVLILIGFMVGLIA